MYFRLLIVLTLLTSAYGADTAKDKKAGKDNNKVASGPASNAFRCNDQSHVKHLSLNNSGETAEGPVCAEIIVNALRYYADFGKATTYTAGPALTSILPSSASPGGGLTPEKTTLEEVFSKYESSIIQVQNQFLTIQSVNREASTFVDSYLGSLK